jgi:hypothetical protein
LPSVFSFSVLLRAPVALFDLSLSLSLACCFAAFLLSGAWKDGPCLAFAGCDAIIGVARASDMTAAKRKEQVFDECSEDAGEAKLCPVKAECCCRNAHKTNY